MKIGLALAIVGVVSTTQMIMVNPAHAWQYGALAAGSCNEVSGRGVNDVSEYEAESGALRQCRKFGGDNCQPVAKISGREGCAAFAVSGTAECNKPTGVGYGADRSAARTEALRICDSQWGAETRCRILNDICPAATKP